jgi:Flp pilus assembly pilin Flp
MSSDRRSFGCVEYTLIIALCAMLGVILYATLQHNPHETHTSITSRPTQIIETSKVSNQPSSNPSIGNKMGNVKGTTMGSTLGAAITKSAATSTTKPSHHSIRYVPIHLHKGMRYVPIRLTPEGQEAD